ncbi:hypothetical protein [Ehrlichia ruminantium]|uniref:Uncharacterized protein n=1 Tax=Ehrlichia ruminantium (strain Welgevonden) TaxID=254945 RepID=A0A0H3M1V1_EHRRW|nr:hypothetical protein [Ehrlichia ruminantium]QLK55412.1 hypothetical protein FDZ62_04110 [Ehrlichia ruminantium]QLK56328.1 hypothetical protein FDZ61_04105 [Ehrlichia ruminantium]QLK57241.1 hypothetical protein FDZ60_04090 [Ehrlichia ruminantium]UOD99528.1 hypothetical protein IMW62_04060 [Ehrlichia ruminantium]CAI27263.1 Hypothetical protein ERWE_CDS_07690 [Ehrlichia ruminantium str. Welgevonden]
MNGGIDIFYFSILWLMESIIVNCLVANIKVDKKELVRWLSSISKLEKFRMDRNKMICYKIK